MAVQVTPNPSIFDEKIQITISNLIPFQDITIFTYVPVSQFCHYESFAQYKASKSGSVNMCADACIGGSYEGVEPMGLIWSVKAFAENKRKIVRFAQGGYPQPVIYYLIVYEGRIEDIATLRAWALKKTKAPLASAQITKLYVAPGVKRIVVRENGLVGTLFLPKEKGPFPGVINLYGGYPGVLEMKSALHAANGIASLTLAYYGVEGLPKHVDDTQDVSYFEKGVEFMTQHPQVDSRNGIGVVSICKGSILALAMATCLKGIKCVVWVNNSVNAVCGDIKYKDRVFHDIGVEFDLPQTSEPIPIGSDYLNFLPPDFTLKKFGEELQSKNSIVPFHEQQHVSYLFIAGLDDQACPTKLTVQLAELMLMKSKHPDYKVVKYEKTGHLIEPPFSPHAPSYFQPGKPFHVHVSCGGETTAHCKAQEDAWKVHLQFLKEKLVPTVQSKL
uniref:Bile acid-CoA:amino acid N-acyltransferase-like n=1 Tax=Phallusia mammillata TaxID=59560 RepID=A0A6F9D850_9ASCI|nr:bile acid-CoA:amino acid N-acyltransferase-like [Phallusia mammillata]